MDNILLKLKLIIQAFQVIFYKIFNLFIIFLVKNSYNTLALKSEVICNENDCVHYFFDHFEALCTQTYFLIYDESKLPLTSSKYSFEKDSVYSFKSYGQEISVKLIKL